MAYACCFVLGTVCCPPLEVGAGIAWIDNTKAAEHSIQLRVENLREEKDKKLIQDENVK